MYVCVNDEGNLVNNDKVEKGTCQPPEDGKVPDGAVCEDRSNQNTKNSQDQWFSKDPSTKWTNNPSTKCANVLSVCSEIDGKFTCVAAKTDGGCTTEKNFCPGGGIRGKDKDCNLDACPLVLAGESCDGGSIVDDSNPCAQGLECNANDETAVCGCVVGNVANDVPAVSSVRGETKICQLADNQPLSDDSSKSLDFNVYLMVFTGVLAVF